MTARTHVRATQRRFIAWLASFPDEAYVGERQQCDRCPLAEFLRWLEPGCQPHVDSGTWTFWAGVTPYRPLPNWAKRVIRVADGLVGYRLKAGTLRAQLTRVLGWQFGEGVA